MCVIPSPTVDSSPDSENFSESENSECSYFNSRLPIPKLTVMESHIDCECGKSIQYKHLNYVTEMKAHTYCESDT